MERIFNAMKENPGRENLMKVWKDYTNEDAIIVIEKVVKAIKAETVNSRCRKVCPNVMHDFTESIKEIIEEIMDITKRMESKEFEIQILEKFKS